MTLDPWEKNSVLAFYDWFTRLLYHVIVDFVWVCDFEATWNFSGSLVSPCYISLCDSYVCPKTRSEIIIWNHYLKKARGGKVISYSCGCAFFPIFFFFFGRHNLSSFGYLLPSPKLESSYMLLVEKVFIEFDCSFLLSCIFLVLLSSWDGKLELHVFRITPVWIYVVTNQGTMQKISF